MSVIVTHEPTGTYRAIALSESGQKRKVLLYSGSFGVASEALKHLLTTSADAVQQYIATTGFGLLTAVDGDGHGGVASVSSYANELDRGGLADSRLSLESEAESAYDSASEDGHYEDGVENVGSERGCAVTGCFGPLSQTQCPSNRPAGYRNATYQAQFPVHNVPAHNHRWSPSNAASSAHASTGHCNDNHIRPGTTFSRFPVPGDNTWLHIAPYQPMGPTAPWSVNAVAPSSSGSGLFGRGNGNSNGVAPQPMPHRPDVPAQAPLPSVTTPSGQMSLPHHQQQRWQQQQQKQPTQQRPPILKSVFQGDTAPNVPRKMQTPPQPQGLQQMHLPPNRSSGAPNPPLVVPASSLYSAAPSVSSQASDASWSASSTPKLTLSPNTPPEYSPPADPAAPSRRITPGEPRQKEQTPLAIDYRLSIRVAGAPCGKEHRIVARTPPTRLHITIAASRYVSANAGTFFHDLDAGQRGPVELAQLTAGPPPLLYPPSLMVLTRAVFMVAGREESYDLAAYEENDLSGLCDSMVEPAGEGSAGAGAGATAWPLFEVFFVKKQKPFALEV